MRNILATIFVIQIVNVIVIAAATDPVIVAGSLGSCASLLVLNIVNGMMN